MLGSMGREIVVSLGVSLFIHLRDTPVGFVSFCSYARCCYPLRGLV